MAEEKRKKVAAKKQKLKKEELKTAEEVTEPKKEEKEIKENAVAAKEKYKGKDTYFVIAVIVLFSFIALFFAVQHFYKPAPRYEVVTYNGFKFVKMSDLWYFNWQKDGKMYVASLHFNPYEVEDIPVYGEVDERFKQQHIYLTHDPAESGLKYVTLTTAELTSNLVATQNIIIEAACSENKTKTCWSRPIITCENTNASVIYIKEAAEARIDLKGNCMVIQGKGYELVKAAEKALYIWYKIM
jgi:hypothetical protein